MSAVAWEAVIQAAAKAENAVEDLWGDDRRDCVEGALTNLATLLDCALPDDLPARAIAMLADAWLAMIAAEYEERLLDDEEVTA